MRLRTARRREPETTKHRPIDSRSSDRTPVLCVAAASHRVHRVRLAIRLLVPLTVVAFVACGGDDAPVPVAQRFPTAADAPGTTPDPDETGETTEDFDEFIAALRPAVIDPDDEEMTTVFQEAGFKARGSGRTLLRRDAFAHRATSLQLVHRA